MEEREEGGREREGGEGERPRERVLICNISSKGAYSKIFGTSTASTTVNTGT